jgi:hypothetical protein
MTVERVERTERFDRVLLFLSQRGGRYQRNQDAFAEEIGIPLSGLRKILGRAVELKLIEVVRSSHPTIGVGRLPNTYVLRIGAIEWQARREEIIASADERKAKAKVGKRRQEARDRAESSAPLDPLLTRAAPTPAPAPPRSGVTATDFHYVAPHADLDVDAWAVDFEL